LIGRILVEREIPGTVIAVGLGPDGVGGIDRISGVGLSVQRIVIEVVSGRLRIDQLADISGQVPLVVGMLAGEPIGIDPV